MDTPTALSTLESLSSNLRGAIEGDTAQVTSIQVALDQLSGVLNTPSADLTAAQNALVAEQAAHASNNAKNAESIATLTSQLEDSQASLVTEQTNHTTDNTNNAATIASLTSDGTAKDGQITDLTTQLATANATITSLQTSVPQG